MYQHHQQFHTAMSQFIWGFFFGGGERGGRGANNCKTNRTKKDTPLVVPQRGNSRLMSKALRSTWWQNALSIHLSWSYERGFPIHSPFHFSCFSPLRLTWGLSQYQIMTLKQYLWNYKYNDTRYNTTGTVQYHKNTSISIIAKNETSVWFLFLPAYSRPSFLTLFIPTNDINVSISLQQDVIENYRGPS